MSNLSYGEFTIFFHFIPIWNLIFSLGSKVVIHWSSHLILGMAYVRVCLFPFIFTFSKIKITLSFYFVSKSFYFVFQRNYSLLLLNLLFPFSFHKNCLTYLLLHYKQVQSNVGIFCFIYSWLQNERASIFINFQAFFQAAHFYFV